MTTGGTQMLLVNHTISDFVEILGSDSPAPGGGSTAALQGALGTALLKMIGLLTTGRAKYAEHQDYIDTLLKETEKIKVEFLKVIDEDTEAFNQVSAVFTMPKETDEDKLARKNAMQEALKACTKTPYKMMQLCKRATELIENAVEKTNPNTASDLGVAVLCLKASAQGAWLNILINIDGITDKAFVDEYRKGGEDVLAKVLPTADRVYESVLENLN